MQEYEIIKEVKLSNHNSLKSALYEMKRLNKESLNPYVRYSIRVR